MLAQPPKASNRALFAYATSPGDTAADGTGRNSPFTSGLLTSIRKEHRLEDVFAETQESVLKKTSKKQKPWTTQSLGDIKFYF
ncbi:MAG: caspase family protein [Methylovulum sp.]|nr:MAG: caspase family protein [Methylovulum sp.]